MTKAKSMDQAQVVMTLISALDERQHPDVIAVTAARGRGKCGIPDFNTFSVSGRRSAAIGLSLAAAVAMGYSLIFVRRPRAHSPLSFPSQRPRICPPLPVLSTMWLLRY